MSCHLFKVPSTSKQRPSQITNFVYAPVKIITILVKSKLWSIEEEDSARWTIQLGNVMVTEGMEFEFRRFTFSFPTRNSAIEPHFLCLGNFTVIKITVLYFSTCHQTFSQFWLAGLIDLIAHLVVLFAETQTNKTMLHLSSCHRRHFSSLRNC